MWGRRTRAAEHQLPVEVDRELEQLEALDVRVLRILAEAATGESLRHARRLTNDLTLMLIGSRTCSFLELDESLDRLQKNDQERNEGGVSAHFAPAAS